ncbi:hypothetical protein C479_00055 [Halovivax asiaticus JCM 14624]|uniref:Uncharacterized protein n=1 Tax=Halovivax asiaticus JCM 14624 TaxID=1227490 RepID=M0BV22_9EURY|nr:hypothetical protein [Halovivax asiaticus]ELZ14253.1 hypothetical protein C479_00055 [Halovivax asiaticus JCM 14624]
MARYYDIILALIPLSLLGIAAVLIVAGLPTVTAIPGGALVATALIGHALFVNGPEDDVEYTAVEAASNSPAVNAD